MKIKTIAIIGGTGFIGHHLTAKLANKGYDCRVITRHSHRHTDLKTSATLIEASVFDRSQMLHALRGVDAVINLVGILNESGRHSSFRRIHVNLVEQLISTCHEAGVKRYLHMSALNADQGQGTSQYLRTKGEGENRAHTLSQPHIAVTSFRPSVIFGTDDSFINRFSALLNIPGPMPLACPKARFAPVHVEDVVDAMANALELQSTHGRHFQLCGPDILSLRDIVKLVAYYRGKKKTIIGLPNWASRLMASLLRFVPGKPLTPDNYLSLQQDSVCSHNNMHELGIKAKSFKATIGAIIENDTKNKQLNRFRKLSGR